MAYNKTSRWKLYREAQGNLGIMQAKIMRRGFLDGYDVGFADGVHMIEGIEDGAPRPSNSPDLSNATDNSNIVTLKPPKR